MNYFEIWASMLPTDKWITVGAGVITAIFLLTLVIFLIKIFKVTPNDSDSDSERFGIQTPLGTFNLKRPAKTFQDPDTIMNHRFFRLMESAKNAAFLFEGSIPTDKDLINVTFLKDCKFKIFREGISEFMKDVESHKGLGLNGLSQLISDLVIQYEKEAKTLVIILNNGREICGVPKGYITKFDLWHARHAKLCIEGIGFVLADRVYSGWRGRALASLEYLYMAFQMTVDDAVHTLTELNGDLDNEIEEMIKNSCK